MKTPEFVALVLKTPSGRHSSSRTGRPARFPCHPAAINPQFVGNRDGIFVGNRVGKKLLEEEAHNQNRSIHNLIITILREYFAKR